jgi:hypothetical protein
MHWVIKVGLGGVAILAGVIVLGMNAPHKIKILTEAKGAVTGQLRNPSSVSFRHVYVFEKGPDDLYVCGQVNGQNGFGGLSGYGRFFYLNGVPVIDDLTPNNGFDAAWSAAGCDKGAESAIESDD